MKKRIDVSEVTIGMYVSELDRPWLETPFLFQGFEVLTESDIRELKQYCKYVFIDIERSFDLETSAALRDITKKQEIAKRPAEEKTAETPEIKIKEVELAYRPNAKALEFEILKKHAAPAQKQAYVDQTSLEQEVQKIRKTYDYAKETVQ
ncbi:MAG: DUF3391 domain-containing protein, partial [Gammaproteobacteria bacterium]|nr:DUF3391 domain-containing protein [Gammaproteobacteria bacterium]